MRALLTKLGGSHGYCVAGADFNYVYPKDYSLAH
jgi:hypothetical protein